MDCRVLGKAGSRKGLGTCATGLGTMKAHSDGGWEVPR